MPMRTMFLWWCTGVLPDPSLDTLDGISVGMKVVVRGKGGLLAAGRRPGAVPRVLHLLRAGGRARPDQRRLGSGCYGGKPGERMAKFIEANAFLGKRVALSGTSAGGAGSEVKAMEVAVKEKGAEVPGRYFGKGQMAAIFSRGHPNPADIDAARKFAREMAGL